ncbi:hypothetical protein KEM48_010257 [Puccinia striiformis f. sp. tritici PST-130]|uniref:Uncharacterized protein n=1 Tax=Puccinia striiformis f. sp. tritici PST-78 TaxID=1165861 RepID=A0A0L0VP80_9BASI|nr:hypothetical protein KEM48_010257 [Puccinia striiformis f. sp. tritici PST-130]KNF01066.1 hypothetical protein PSTG_05696 [Puccinia striiformis f. sp. tritici PST-78]
MDLTVLTSPSAGIHSVSDQSGPTHDTITCFRLSGLTPQVWLVCVSSAASLPTTVLASICWDTMSNLGGWFKLKIYDWSTNVHLVERALRPTVGIPDSGHLVGS